MSEVETPVAGNQPQPADTTQADNSDFLGTTPEPDYDAAETPEPSAAQEGEGETAETEGQEAEPEGEQQTEAEPQGEFLATLSPEEHAYYAKRYPTLYKAAQDPNQPDDLRQAFVDRVNQDRAFEEMRSGKDEPTVETEEQTTEGQQQPVEPAKLREQHYARVDEIVANFVDPQAMEELGKNLLAGFGVDLTSKDPEVQALVKDAPKVGQTLARGAVDLVLTTVAQPEVLGPALEAVMPGFTRMYNQSLYQLLWDDVRSTKQGEATPYAKLPAWGSEQFMAALAKTREQFPGFDQMVFTDANRRPLPKAEQVRQKHMIVAKIAAGQAVSPATVQKAVETGRRIERQTAQKRAAGRALGAGQGNKQFVDPKKSDPIMDDLDAAIARANADLNPLTKR